MDETPRYIPLSEMEAEDDLFGEEWDTLNKIRNEFFLDEFYKDLLKAGLKKKTIGDHINNVFYFLDELARREGYEMERCIAEPGMFLGDWFIRRCMWSTPANIKTTAASIKKFAKSMLNRNYISQSDYDSLVSDIKENLAEWQHRCARYNDPNDQMTPDQYRELFDRFI